MSYGEREKRVRRLFAAWSGGPLTMPQVAALIGVEPGKPMYNSLNYLARKGELQRLERGKYVAPDAAR